MNRIAISIAAVLLFSITGWAKPDMKLVERNDGYFWEAIQKEEPLGAMMLVAGYLQSHDPRPGSAHYHSPAALEGKTAQEKLNRFAKIVVRPQQATFGQWVKTVDEFYRDARNKRLKLPVTIEYAERVLNHASQESINVWLEKNRRTDQKPSRENQGYRGEKGLRAT
jgi:hypothetical protein